MVHRYVIGTIAVRLCVTILFCGRCSGVLYHPDSYFTENLTREDTVFGVSNFTSIIDRGSKIRKTHYRNLNRVLFVAGLEGTEPHAWQHAIAYCRGNNLCVVEREISEAMMHVDPATWTMHGLFGNEDLQDNANLLTFIYERMLEIGEGRVADSPLRIIGLAFSKYAGMMSYPNYDVPNKSLSRPDIVTMAAIAESAKVDFRVLVLQRQPTSIMASVERRQFGFGLEPQVLLANAESLYLQMRALDPKFYHCFRYESHGYLSVEERISLMLFISPLLDNYWDGMLKACIRGITSSTGNYGSVKFLSDSKDFQDTVVPSERLAGTILELNNLYDVKMLETRTKMIDALCEERNQHR